MSYEKHTWTDGETITAAKLNNVEDGIEEAAASGGGYDFEMKLTLPDWVDLDYAAEEATLSDFTILKGSVTDMEQKIASGEPIKAILYWEIGNNDDYHEMGQIPLGIFDQSYGYFTFFGFLAPYIGNVTQHVVEFQFAFENGAITSYSGATKHITLTA